MVSDDQEGVAAMMDWLSYVPKTADALPVELKSADPVDRLVDFVPTKVRPLSPWSLGTLFKLLHLPNDRPLT